MEMQTPRLLETYKVVTVQVETFQLDQACLHHKQLHMVVQAVTVVTVAEQMDTGLMVEMVDKVHMVDLAVAVLTAVAVAVAVQVDSQQVAVAVVAEAGVTVLAVAVALVVQEELLSMKRSQSNDTLRMH
jgi:hypothetical protein